MRLLVSKHTRVQLAATLRMNVNQQRARKTTEKKRRSSDMAHSNRGCLFLICNMRAKSIRSDHPTCVVLSCPFAASDQECPRTSQTVHRPGISSPCKPTCDERHCLAVDPRLAKDFSATLWAREGLNHWGQEVRLAPP